MTIEKTTIIDEASKRPKKSPMLIAIATAMADLEKKLDEKEKIEEQKQEGKNTATKSDS